MDIPFISQGCAQDIDKVITRACNEALDFVRDESRFIAPYMVLQDISHSILALVQQSIAAFARRQNKRAIVLTMLPSEILGLICSFIPMEDCITVTHICQKLRNLLLSGNPLLWNDITFSNVNGRLTALLERSASGDIHLSGRVTHSNWLEVSRCLKNHLHRCTSLRVVLCELPLEARAVITQSLCTPAPRLHTFKIFDPLQQFNTAFDANIRLFSGDAPNLTLIKAHANVSSIAPAGSSFSSVRRLLFSPANTGASMADITSVLERFPNLKALFIDLDDWSDDGQPKVSLSDTLEVLNIISSNSLLMDPVPVFARIYHDHSDRQGLVSYDIPASSEAVRAVINSSPPAGQRLDALSLYTGSRPSKVASVNFLERTVSPAPEQAPFAHITLLTLAEDIFQYALPLPRAPMLKYLSIVLRRPLDGINFAHETVFLLPRNPVSGGPFVCPSLQQLLFSAAPDEPIMNIDPALVREFVEGYLQFDSATLPVLLLQHTRLLENVPEDIARLLARVETVTVADEKTGSPPSSVSEVWSSIAALRHWE